MGGLMHDSSTTRQGVTVEQFRAVLLEAVKHTDVVQPPALREPVSLWLRSVEERARRENWPDLLGKPVEYAWEAAQVILATGVQARRREA